MDGKTTRIIVKNVAEIVFTYTSDAHDGSYSVEGPKAQEVLELLDLAAREEKWVNYLMPMKIYNPKSYVWILEVLKGNYGYQNMSVENMPLPEHFSDYDPNDTGLDEDGNQIIY